MIWPTTRSCAPERRRRRACAAIAAVWLTWAAAGFAAPVDARLPTLDGTALDFAQQRGRWLVLNFWATWCAPCVEEIPELEAFHRDPRHADVVLVGVNFEPAAPEAVRAFLQRFDVSYPIALAGIKPVPGLPRVKGLPTTLILDPRGELVRTYVGPLTAAGLEFLLAELREAGAPTPHP